MASKLPEEILEEFLAGQTPWVRGILLGEPHSWETLSALQKPGAFELLGKARDRYMELLRPCPARLHEYRNRVANEAAKSALSRVPSGRPGAPRQDAFANEAADLQHEGISQPEIARELNRRHPNRKDRKGNKLPFTAEGVRKMLKRRRKLNIPDKT